MIHRHLPSDQRIIDEVFSLTALPGLHEVGWLLGMVATFGKTPTELKGFTWNEDGTINITSKKRPVAPLHPQWSFLFQLKEKQPSKKKSCWNTLSDQLTKALEANNFTVTVDGLLLAYKVRKIYYTPLKRSGGCEKKTQQRCLVA